MSITVDVKKKIVIGILNVFAKTGASIKQVNDEYTNQTGEKLAPTKSGGEEYMKSLYPDVIEDMFGRYRSNSEKSAHIVKMVAEQNTKFSPNYRGNTRIFNNALNRTFHNVRPTVSYKNDFIDVNFTQRGPTSGSAAAGKINRRRMTCGPFNISSSSETEAKKRRSVTPDRGRGSKRFRSRSRSPPRSTRSPSGRRHRSRSRSPPKWPNRNRSRSPQSRRYRSRSRSPPRRQNQPSISPSYSPPCSPGKSAPDQRNKRSNSPADSRSRPYYESHASRQQGTRSPIKNPETNIRDNAPQGGINTDNNWPKSTDARLGNTNAARIEPVKTKKFKFTIIGDGYMFYMLSDMQSEAKFNLSMCNHTLTIADAMKMVEVQHHTLQNKKRKVMIAIGVTDLRNGRSLPDIKREFTALFLLCDKYGLKPLITTILCFDSPELKAKADLFNKFLTECFENVIDMRAVLRCGLADVMTSLNKKHAMKLNKNSLGLGTRQQLILNVPK